MIAVVLFGVFGIGFLLMGGLVMAGAPAVTQEMAGILLILCGIVSLGFGAVLSTLNQMHKTHKQQQ